VKYSTDEKPGTIIINTRKRYLYLVKADGKAMRFGIGVGRQGFRWRGTEKISRKAEWPAWHSAGRDA
jgi:lipoprotein-anchoring transpeptidase ErfK/SrfK